MQFPAVKKKAGLDLDGLKLWVFFFWFFFLPSCVEWKLGFWNSPATTKEKHTAAGWVVSWPLRSCSWFLWELPRQSDTHPAHIPSSRASDFKTFCCFFFMRNRCLQWNRYPQLSFGGENTHFLLKVSVARCWQGGRCCSRVLIAVILFWSAHLLKSTFSTEQDLHWWIYSFTLSSTIDSFCVVVTELSFQAGSVGNSRGGRQGKELRKFYLKRMEGKWIPWNTWHLSLVPVPCIKMGSYCQLGLKDALWKMQKGCTALLHHILGGGNTACKFHLLGNVTATLGVLLFRLWHVEPHFLNTFWAFPGRSWLGSGIIGEGEAAALRGRAVAMSGRLRQRARPLRSIARAKRVNPWPE